MLNRTDKATIPWRHRHVLFTSHAAAQIFHHVPGIVIRYKGTPARTYSLSTVEQHMRYNRNVPLRLNTLTIVIQVVEEVVIFRMEHQTRNAWHCCENVTCTGCIFAAHASSTKLTVGQQQVHVVTAAVVLRKADNRHDQTLITMVIRRML